jgi:N-acetylated-alpha-linked acidic dipeptidase
VSVIVYLIIVIVFNLYRQWCEPLSQSEIEKRILESPTPEYLKSQSFTYTSGAHLAGKNQTQATYTRDLWESYGIQTEIEEYQVLLNYPLSHRLALFINNNDSLQYEAELREDVIPEDATSANPDEVPTFHGYSANGNVTGELVYANFGRIDDFRILDKMGVNVSGKVVIMRYGTIFRGLQVKAAQGITHSKFESVFDETEYGAIGAILYSDPHEDRDLANATQYPNGPGRHPSAVQRGTVLFLSKLPGDPSTPGFASKPGVNRTDPKEYIPSIPSLPISFRDALPFLKSLNGGKLCGFAVGENWAGSLTGVEYCVQNSDTRPTVNLLNQVQFLLTPIYNIIGRIPGAMPEEIILGNHRDAWVYGAGDPISGSAPMNAVASAFGRLVKRGWKPLRTLVFASWDAEEYGLVGSTEWVEDHATHLTKNTLAYLNVDIGAVGDRLNIQASPLLNDVLIQVTKDVITESGSSVYDVWKNTSHGHPVVGALGSGSDYTGFLQLLGIASSHMGFASANAVYQCTWDHLLSLT